MVALTLVEGNIPAGQGCAWTQRCKFFFDRCPTEAKPNPLPFSCAAARAWAMISEEESKEKP